MTNPAPQPLVAAVWMIGAIVSFSSMAVAGRALSFELDTFEIMLYRSLLGIVVVVSVGYMAGSLGQISTRHMGVQVARNISHFAGQNLWFYALTVAPLAQVFALEFTSPIWAMFFAVLVLGEKLTGTRVLSALIGFAGILIVTQPWQATGGLDAGIVAAALAAIGFAGSAVFTRLLTRTETITCILFWLTVTQTVFGVICAGYDGDIALPSTGSIPWLILIGLAGLVAHYCLTKALSLAPASVVMPIDFARLPIIALIGFLIYDEALRLPVLLGAALIFSGNYFNLMTEARSGRARKT